VNKELKPIVSKLMEIQRKVEPLGGRIPQFALFGAILENIVESLKTGRDPSGGPVNYREIVAAIDPLARLFESLGFMHLARDIVLVQKSLQDLDSSGAPPRPTSIVPTASPSVRPAVEETVRIRPLQDRPSDVLPPVAEPVALPPLRHRPAVERPVTALAAAAVDGRSIRTSTFNRYVWLHAFIGACIAFSAADRWVSLALFPRILISIVVGVLAGSLVAWIHGASMALLKRRGASLAAGVLILALVVLPWLASWIQAMVLIAENWDTLKGGALEEPAPAATTAVSPAPVPEDASTRQAAQQSPQQKAVVTSPSPKSALPPDLLAGHRIVTALEALRAHDYATARRNLDAAERIAGKSREVLEAARHLILGLTAAAEDAVSAGDTALVRRRLDEAESVAVHYGFPADAIVERRAVLFPQGETAVEVRTAGEVRPYVGTTVKVVLQTGEVKEGKILRVDDDAVYMEVLTTISGGKVSFRHSIPITDISVIRVPR